MATWTQFDPADFLPKKPIISSQGIGLATNPGAAVQGAADAPYNLATWAPYDANNIGIGGTGIIYDGAVDGTVANVETPDFEDGYEYKLYLDGLSLSVNNDEFRFELFRQGGGAYSTITVTNPFSSNFMGGTCEIYRPRVASRFIMFKVPFLLGSSGSGVALREDVEQSFVFQFGTGTDRILKIRSSPATGNITGGIIRMFRRRDFSSPL